MITSLARHLCAGPTAQGPTARARLRESKPRSCLLAKRYVCAFKRARSREYLSVYDVIACNDETLLHPRGIPRCFLEVTYAPARIPTYTRLSRHAAKRDCTVGLTCLRDLITAGRDSNRAGFVQDVPISLDKISRASRVGIAFFSESGSDSVMFNFADSDTIELVAIYLGELQIPEYRVGSEETYLRILSLERRRDGERITTRSGLLTNSNGTKSKPSYANERACVFTGPSTLL